DPERGQEHLASLEDPPPGCFFLRTQHVGYLPEGQVLFDPQQQGSPVFGGQPSDRSSQSLQSLPTFQDCRRPLVGGGQVVRQGFALTSPSAQVVGKTVVGNPEQPGPEVRPGPKPLQMRQNLQKRLLGQVLGRMPVVRQVVEPPKEPFPVALHQVGKG